MPSTPLETISFDVRKGGLYRYTMVNIETGEEFLTGGVFLDVVPFERLVFTCAD
ncbi:SRPBCC domain-containing protein [Neobacillus niacini]|uniref:SRPBCC domain-containing protein n=1 Tax=Neobacillus niacini TaxID=86668 RepID=UPI0037C53544